MTTLRLATAGGWATFAVALSRVYLSALRWARRTTTDPTTTQETDR